MTPGPRKKDLVVLAADKNMEFAVTGLLTRHPSLGIREVTADVKRHPLRDPGCLCEGVEFLEPLRAQYEHALLIFVFEGSATTETDPTVIETTLDAQLKAHWGECAATVVIAPELEAWVWADSPHLPELLGWAGPQTVREWLVTQGYALLPNGKPNRPKEALEEVLRSVRKPRSSRLYRAVAETVGLLRCTDRAFLRLRGVLQTWFGDMHA